MHKKEEKEKRIIIAYMGSNSIFVARLLFRALLVLVLVGLVCVFVLVNGGNGGRTRKASETLQVKKIARDNNMMSNNNRRVFNGPDPIHNRRAGNNSGQPPAQS
ncbi:hypothetical protein HN51_013665 [Arachis hypogaea]|nr:uncharacterized protein DS421_3g99150 [Arachis hypogaea]RYR64994.1 hypothetical protein Ahy_A03g010998 isoform B [Arachis hypogaea]